MVPQGVRVARGIGAAQVERAEKFAVQKIAFKGVARFGKECLHDGCSRNERVVVVHGEESFYGNQFDRRQFGGVFVAAYRKNLTGVLLVQVWRIIVGVSVPRRRCRGC